MRSKDSLLKLFENKSHVKLQWYWEPFHQTGIKFLEFCKKNKISDQKMEELMNNLSVARSNAKIAKLAPHILDQYGRLLPLDPTERIRLTTKLTANENFFAVEVADLRKKLKNWEPKTELMEEFRELKNLWGQKPQILERFMALSAWDKLELFESLFGLTKSHTTLEFQRIDEASAIP